MVLTLLSLGLWITGGNLILIVAVAVVVAVVRREVHGCTTYCDGLIAFPQVSHFVVSSGMLEVVACLRILNEEQR